MWRQRLMIPTLTMLCNDAHYGRLGRSCCTHTALQLGTPTLKRCASTQGPLWMSIATSVGLVFMRVFFLPPWATPLAHLRSYMHFAPAIALIGGTATHAVRLLKNVSYPSSGARIMRVVAICTALGCAQGRVLTSGCFY